MQGKSNLGDYLLTPIHLIIVGLGAAGTLIYAMLWRWVGAVILAYGGYCLFSYWIGVLYHNARREHENALHKMSASTLTCREADIRPATPEDAREAARLMASTSRSMMLTFFGSPERVAVRSLRRVFPLPGHTSSYTSSMVVEDRGDVVALLSAFSAHGYRAAERADWIYAPIWSLAVTPWRFPMMFLARMTYDKVKPPLRDGDFFIEHLAVSPERRGQGLGSCLMDFAESLASVRGLERMVLDVEVANKGARRFYERAGFVESEFVTDKHYCEQFDFEGTVRLTKPI